jgi:uncharacterized coiled-coil DUF342 family protein
MRSWEDRYRELEDVHRTLERTSAEERERAWRDFDEWKSATVTKHDAEKIALAIQFDKKLKQAGQDAEEASELRSQLQEALEERDNLRKQRDEAETKAEEEAARANQLAREKDELMNQYNQLKAESQQEKEVIRSVASNLESEKSRLEKMMECYGDIAEIKSKGDNY